MLLKHQCQIIMTLFEIVGCLSKPIARQHKLGVQIIIGKAKAIELIFISQFHLTDFLFALGTQPVIKYDMHGGIADPARNKDEKQRQNHQRTAGKWHKSNTSVLANINLSLGENLAKFVQQAGHEVFPKISFLCLKNKPYLQVFTSFLSSGA